MSKFVIVKSNLQFLAVRAEHVLIDAHNTHYVKW